MEPLVSSGEEIGEISIIIGRRLIQFARSCESLDGLRGTYGRNESIETAVPAAYPDRAEAVPAVPDPERSER
jgi:hypothetical protein